MKRPILSIYFIILIALISFQSFSQSMNNTMDSITMKSKLWDKAFKERDTITYFKFVSKDVALTVGGGSLVGLNRFKNLTRSLFSERPDIAFTQYQKKIEINEQWKIAYDTGEWLEIWTEKNDTRISEIFGKYWRMWKYIDNEWKIMSIIFTPLSCKGSYCNQ